MNKNPFHGTGLFTYTFTIKIHQVWVNILYQSHGSYGYDLICIFVGYNRLNHQQATQKMGSLGQGGRGHDSVGPVGHVINGVKWDLTPGAHWFSAMAMWGSMYNVFFFNGPPCTWRILEDQQLSNEKDPSCFFQCIFGILLHSYMGITINHYKDPYETTSMESKAGCFSWLNCLCLQGYG